MYNLDAEQPAVQKSVSTSTASSGRSLYSFPPLNWSSIFAGLVAGLATYILLTLMGIATGLSAIDLNRSGAGIENVSTWTTVWNGASMLLSAFVGGFVAARMSGLRRKLDGVMHGLVVWGATTLLFVVLSASAASALVGGAFNTLIQPRQPIAAQGNDPSAIISQLRAAVTPEINTNALTDENIEQLQTMVRNRDRQGAINFMTSNMGVDSTLATRTVDQLFVATGAPELASPQTRNEMNRTVDVAQTALWILFLAVLFSAAISMGGGVAGVKNARRVRRPLSSSSTGAQATV